VSSVFFLVTEQRGVPEVVDLEPESNADSQPEVVDLESEDEVDGGSTHARGKEAVDGQKNDAQAQPSVVASADKSSAGARLFHQQT
jgi:hypothetical protein